MERVEGLSSAVFLLVYLLLLGFSVLYARFPLDASSVSRGGLGLLAITNTLVVLYSVGVGGAYLLTKVVESGYGYVDAFHFSSFAVFYVLIIVVYLSVYFICRERNARVQNAMEVEAIRSTGDMKMFAEANMAQAREMRHDFKNQIAYMDVLLKSGNLEELGKAMDAMTEDAMTPASYVDCGNVEVSSILSMESVKASSHGFALDPLIVVPAVLPFEGSDLCAILSNMCDNAIESNLRYGISDPIEVRMRLRNGCLYIRVSNSLPEGADAERILSLETRKADRGEHGIGTGVIRKLSEKYGGSAYFDVSGGKFIAEAVLDMGAGNEESDEEVIR